MTIELCEGLHRVRACRAAAVFALLVLSGAYAQAQTNPAIELRNCETLMGTALAAEDLALPSSGAIVTIAERRSAEPQHLDTNGEIVLPTPAHCRLAGEIRPVDADAPEIRFNVNLPLQWNGRAIHSGGGGLGGVVNTAPGEKGSGRFDPQPVTDTYPLSRGYVTFGSDEGHRSGEIAFIYNDEALRNWAGAALKKTHDVALMLIEKAYGRAPARMYFAGESAGGKEALYMAQRHGEDYDGVIAVSPVLSWTYIHLADNNIRSRLVDGWLDAAAIELIANATRAACDGADGLVDGVIARYMACRHDPRTLLCPDGERGEGCLSNAQLLALNAIREPWATSVPHAYGIDHFPGYGVTGDEDGAVNQYAFYTVGTEPPVHPLPPGRGFQRGLGAVLNFGVVWVRHVMAQDEAFEPYDFYPPAYSERIQYISALFDSTNPDLSALAGHGGKLLILHHSADNAVSTPMVADYYRSVGATMGRAAADDVVRLYIGPGGAHNGTGIAQTDLLSLLVDWVERDMPPPAEIPIYDIDPATQQTRRGMVACVYPSYARYIGHGDPNVPASFRCEARQDPLEHHASR